MQNHRWYRTEATCQSQQFAVYLIVRYGISYPGVTIMSVYTFDFNLGIVDVYRSVAYIRNKNNRASALFAQGSTRLLNIDF